MKYDNVTATVHYYLRKGFESHEDSVAFLKAVEEMVKIRKNPILIADVARFFYENEDYENALKYYEMAAENGSNPANLWLGHMWFTGRAGVRNFEKAYNYYMKSMKSGNYQAMYYIGQMYRFGFYVEKDEELYRKNILALYKKLKNRNNVMDPIAEVCVNMASIDPDNALMYFKKAKENMALRVLYSRIDYNIHYMKAVLQGLDEMNGIDYDNLSFFDLMLVLQKNCVVSFSYLNKEYEIEVVDRRIYFEDEVYLGEDDFLSNAQIGNKNLYSLSLKNIRKVV